MDHLGERAAWQEHPNTIFMDSESDGEDAAEMPVFEATEGSEGGSGGPPDRCGGRHGVGGEKHDESGRGHPSLGDPRDGDRGH